MVRGCELANGSHGHIPVGVRGRLRLQRLGLVDGARQTGTLSAGLSGLGGDAGTQGHVGGMSGGAQGDRQLRRRAGAAALHPRGVRSGFENGG